MVPPKGPVNGPGDLLMLTPEKRLCPRFDPCGVSWDHSAQRGERQGTVLDNCAEEHMM